MYHFLLFTSDSLFDRVVTDTFDTGGFLVQGGFG